MIYPTSLAASLVVSDAENRLSRLTARVGGICAELVSDFKTKHADAARRDPLAEQALARVSILGKVWARKCQSYQWGPALSDGNTASISEIEKDFYVAMLRDVVSSRESCIANIGTTRAEELTYPETESIARRLCLIDEMSAEFYQDLHAGIRAALLASYPDVAIESIAAGIAPQRGTIRDWNGVDHHLRDGVSAAAMIKNGEVPEIPSSESHLMHAELDRLGLFVNRPSSPLRHGERFCNSSALRYVVYHIDGSGQKSRDVHFWSYLGHASNRRELMAWGDREGEALVELPITLPQFEVTYLLRCGCEDALVDPPMSEVGKAFDRHFQGVESSLLGVASIKSTRVSGTDRVEWQPAHGVNIHLVVSRHGIDEEWVKNRDLGIYERQLLTDVVRALYKSDVLIVPKFFELVECSPIVDDLSEAVLLDRPRG
jgi:hypothetical protein